MCCYPDGGCHLESLKPPPPSLFFFTGSPKANSQQWLRAGDVGRVARALALVGAAWMPWCVHCSGSGRVPARSLVWLWRCSSAQGPSLGCLRRWAHPCAHRHLVPITQHEDAYTACFTWEGTVFPKGDEGSHGAEQQRLPAHALAGSLGSPSSSTGTAHTAHGLAAV